MQILIYLLLAYINNKNHQFPLHFKNIIKSVISESSMIKYFFIEMKKPNLQRTQGRDF